MCLNKGNGEICIILLKKRKNLKTMKARHWQFIPKENMSLISILYSQ